MLTQHRGMLRIEKTAFWARKHWRVAFQGFHPQHNRNVFGAVNKRVVAVWQRERLERKISGSLIQAQFRLSFVRFTVLILC